MGDDQVVRVHAREASASRVDNGHVLGQVPPRGRSQGGTDEVGADVAGGNQPEAPSMQHQPDDLPSDRAQPDMGHLNRVSVRSCLSFVGEWCVAESAERLGQRARRRAGPTGRRSSRTGRGGRCRRRRAGARPRSPGSRPAPASASGSRTAGPVDLRGQHGVGEVGDRRQPRVGEQDQPPTAVAGQPGELEGVALVAAEVEDDDRRRARPGRPGRPRARRRAAARAGRRNGTGGAGR